MNFTCTPEQRNSSASGSGRRRHDTPPPTLACKQGLAFLIRGRPPAVRAAVARSFKSEGDSR